MIKIDRNVSAPSILSSNQTTRKMATIKAQVTRYLSDYKSGEKKVKFNERQPFNNTAVKNELLQMQYGKCCYCESKIQAVSFGDVEHFRPKGAVRQSETDDRTYPGYYWLAYEWDNLLVSCSICNIKYKNDIFPLRDPLNRVRHHDQAITAEDEMLLNPAEVDPENFIKWRKEVPRGVDDRGRGEATIATVGLRRNALQDRRFEHYTILFDWLKSLYAMLESREHLPHHLQESADERIFTLINRLRNACTPNSEYSAMASEALGNSMEENLYLKVRELY